MFEMPKIAIVISKSILEREAVLLNSIDVVLTVEKLFHVMSA